MTQASDWYMRVYFPAGAKASLGFGYEYWRLDPSLYEGSGELKAKGTQLGRKSTKRQLAYQLVENLLTDVVAAAGGAEHSIVAMRNAVAKAQEWVAEQQIQKEPGVPHGISHESVADAWYEFANLLAWARAVEERMDRRPPPSKKKAPVLPRQGLANAVKPKRLQKRVNAILVNLRAGPLAETRLLANFTLHAAMVRDPNQGARLTDDGKVRLPLPDKSTVPIYNTDLFSWSDGRDATEFAELLWTSIREFVDDLITAFEKAVPKRLRK